MKHNNAVTYIAVIFGAVTLGMIIGLTITNIQLFSEENNKVVISLGKNPGINGNWSYESTSDFRYLYFSEDGCFKFEQWVINPYTMHIQYTGRWDTIGTDTYRLYPDLLRADIPALLSPYRHCRDLNGIYVYDTLKDNMDRTYVRSDHSSITEISGKETLRDALQKKEDKTKNNIL